MSIYTAVALAVCVRACVNSRQSFTVVAAAVFLCNITIQFHELFFLFAVMIATEEEMVSAKLPLEERDYCAHTKIDYLRCIADVWPLPYKCAHEKHAQALCQYDE